MDAEARAALITHLRRMVTEDGWLPEQRASARAALEVITPGSSSLPPEDPPEKPAGG